MKMNGFNFKCKKLLINLMYLIVLICVISTFVINVKANKSKRAKATNAPKSTDNAIIQDIAGEEINIEDLKSSAEEGIASSDSTNDTSKTISQTPKNNNTNKSTTNINKPSTSLANRGYYIKVNYGANVVTIYTSDDSGNYTVPVKAMICSTGTATPRSGTYKIKSRWEWLGLIGGVYGHYSTQITGNILFHSVPYLQKYNPASLEYWEYDKLGTSASAGCVRLTIADAKWIYNNIPRGTIVEFYSSGDPGPLGKPYAQKISGNVECRNWDPTDSNSSNPWHSYNVSQPPVQQEPEKPVVVPPQDNTTSDNILDTNITDNNIADNTADNTIDNNISNNNTTDNNISDENTTDNNTADNNTSDNNTDTNTFINGIDDSNT